MAAARADLREGITVEYFDHLAQMRLYADATWRVEAEKSAAEWPIGTSVHIWVEAFTASERPETDPQGHNPVGPARQEEADQSDA